MCWPFSIKDSAVAESKTQSTIRLMCIESVAN